MRDELDIKKLGYGLVVFIATTLICVALLIYSEENQRRITRENREYLVDNTEMTAERIDEALTEGYDNIRVLGVLVGDSLKEPYFDISSIQGLINDSVFDFMEFADKDGMDHNITGGVSNAKDRQYYLDAKQGNVGMELIYVSRATHETLLMYYAPIYYDDVFVGSLVGAYQASNRITKLLSTEFFGEPAVSFLATDEGRIIASNQRFDPTNERYLTELAGGNGELEQMISDAILSGETITFTYQENKTGGCMMRLPRSGYYLVQIFPPNASKRMIDEANRLAYNLVVFLIILSITILISMALFYSYQRKQVETAKNQAEVASLAKTSFLFNMSHDIRTPMNAIIGFNKMAIKNISDKEKVKDSLEKIDKASNMLLSLINSILDMSRIEAGKAILDECKGNIYYSFENVDVTMFELAKSKDIELSININNIKNPYVYLDKDRTTRIFTNIITNAIKYTNEGGHVKVTCERVGDPQDGYGTYRYVFTDDGIGMSEEFQEHIFEEFTREENSTTSGIQGTGLGLSVVKSFVDLMEGNIECISKQGIGTTFIVTLPLKIRSADSYDLKLNMKERDDGKHKFSFEGRRVLLCEDNELNSEIACEILEEQGMIADTVVNGKECLEKIAENGINYYDFILMDIQMPVMGGFEATRILRMKYPKSKIPIIALSANAFAEDKAASIEAGMNDHVAKPINIDELYHVISKYLQFAGK